MAQTYFAVVGYRSGDTESLQAFADSFGSIGRMGTIFLDCNRSPDYVGPFCIFETDGLSFFTSLIRIETMSFSDSIGFFDVFDTGCVQCSKDLLDTTVLAFKFYFSFCHSVFLLFYS